MTNYGDIRECELYNAITNRFGRNCVYHSPRIRVHGQEKELGDVVVLALPYMIVVQSKWKQMTDVDLAGQSGDVYRNRLIRTMKEAARQFKELACSLRQKSIVELPQIWANDNNLRFQFPLDLVEHIIPVVVVDFHDANYDDPERRCEGVPPVVEDVPSQIRNWGVVHSFLFNDFCRILEHLFTVGDLIMWLKEREQMVGEHSRAFIGYNELSLFTVYMCNYDVWEKFHKADAVFLIENDFFEQAIKDKQKWFLERKKKFEKRNIIDTIENLIIQHIAESSEENQNEAIILYLICYGRLLCCSPETKQQISSKYQSCILALNGAEQAYLGFFAIPDKRMPLLGTAYYFGVCNSSDPNIPDYIASGYKKTCGVLSDHDLIRDTNEILITFVSSDISSVVCCLRKQNCLFKEVKNVD